MPELHFEANAHFDCQSCGQCCRTDWNIRVEKSKADRLKSMGPELKIVTDSGGSHFTAKKDGQCAFLNSEQLCEVHADAGLQAKPLTCQLFPFVLTPTSQGVSVGLSFYCPSVRASCGREVSEHRTDLERWLRELELSPGSGRPIPIFGKMTTGNAGLEFLENELRERLQNSEPIELLRGLRWTLSQHYQEFGRQSPEEMFSQAPHPPSEEETLLVSELCALAGLLTPSEGNPDEELTRRYLLSLLHRKFLLKGPNLLTSLTVLSLIPQAIKLCGNRTDLAIEQLELLLTHGQGAFHLTFSMPD